MLGEVMYRPLFRNLNRSLSGIDRRDQVIEGDLTA